MHHPKLEELVRRDPRYAVEAYEFVFAALTHTQKMLGRTPESSPFNLAVASEAPDREEEYHVSGQQLLLGLRDLALHEFGLMARTVFRVWGINRTDDFGEIVFNLIDAGLMSRTERDNRLDFHDVYDLDEALDRHYRIEIPQEAEDT
jgi:uncharacterized repeat protein (TIGR04138 family)